MVRLAFHAAAPVWIARRVFWALRGRPVVHFVNNYRTENAGDRNACPLPYFAAQFGARAALIRHDLYFLRKCLVRKGDVVVIGGGGLLDCVSSWNERINFLVKRSGRAVLWGAGFNMHRGRPVSPRLELAGLRLSGIRDFGHPSGLAWVPCVSCMHSVFDEDGGIQRRIGVVSHKDFPSKDFSQYESLNNYESMERIVRFIRGCEVVATSSYHVMYWATLLKKKVVLFNAFSEKFDYFKYPPARYSGDMEADIARARVYPEAMSECRAATRAFFHRLETELFA